MRDGQYRILWTGVCSSKKIKAVMGDKWFRLGCHLTYTWLILWGDDDGRLRGEPLKILANIVPNEGFSIPDIEKILRELERVELIQWYTVDGEQFIQILSWNEHQSIRKDRYKPSIYPPWQPNDNQLTTEPQPNVHPILLPLPLHIECATFFLEEIRKNHPSFKEPNLNQWAKDIELMIRIDKRDPEDIKRLIRWVQSDHGEGTGKWKGWAVNILSPAKLREKYDEITMRSKNAKGKPTW